MAESKHIGKYEIVEEIGRGGFAVVYKACDTELDRIVALKVLHPQLTIDSKFVERFKREARNAAGLDHPHIATVYEVGGSAGQLFIAMELVDGHSLARCIQEQWLLPWGEALAILDQVASALDYAHEQGLVHRDIKPSNILLDPDKGALLGDFGLSKLIESSGYSLTATGGVLGTPAYIAPEIWAGERPVPASDIYALACVLYEMITGEVLFGTDSPLIVMKRHDEGPQLDESKVEEGFRAILLRALKESPDERYHCAGEFAAALRGRLERLKVEQEEKQRQEQAADLLAHGRQAAREKQWDKAIASFESVLEMDDGDRAARRALAQAQRARARATRARKVPGWAWALGGLVILALLVGGLLGGVWRPSAKATPMVTATVEPTLTPTGAPAAAPTSTHTPAQTKTPTPTCTPAPTKTPTRTPTATPLPQQWTQQVELRAEGPEVPPKIIAQTFCIRGLGGKKHTVKLGSCSPGYIMPGGPFEIKFDSKCVVFYYMEDNVLTHNFGDGAQVTVVVPEGTGWHHFGDDAVIDLTVTFVGLQCE